MANSNRTNGATAIEARDRQSRNRGFSWTCEAEPLLFRLSQ
jgi:hypothetical protein